MTPGSEPNGETPTGPTTRGRRRGSDTAGVFESSRRELRWVVAMGLVFGIWVLGVGWTLGHAPEGGDGPRLILGLPSWVFWGVALPWAAATAFSIAFALFGIRDCPLETVEGEEIDEDRGRRPRTDAGNDAGNDSEGGRR